MRSLVERMDALEEDSCTRIRSHAVQNPCHPHLPIASAPLVEVHAVLIPHLQHSKEMMRYQCFLMSLSAGGKLGWTLRHVTMTSASP